MSTQQGQSVSEADVLARAIRNGHEHDGSDCDYAVDQDAERYVRKLHEFGYLIIDADTYRRNLDRYVRMNLAVKAVMEAYMSGAAMGPSLAQLEAASAFRQQVGS